MDKRMIHTPEGVRDIYGGELRKKRFLEQKLHHTIASYGYHDIQTPTFEFFDIFSREVGTTPSKELYKFFDKEGNTLVLRPDFTPSVARCAAKYFVEDEMPIRLCYEGNAFTNTSSLQGKLKEATQMGAELIGDDSVEADAELICMVIAALKNAGFVDFQISIGEVEYFKGICEEASLDEETVAELREYISAKNYFAAGELLRGKGISDKELEDLLNNNDICTIDDLKEIRNKTTVKKAAAAIDRLIELYDVVSIYGYERYISFDLGMLSKFHYYTGVIFKAYTYGVGDAIVKGGRYDCLLHQFGREAAAVGCVFLIDDILSAYSGVKNEALDCEKEIRLVFDTAHRKEAVKEMEEYRDRGFVVAAILCDSEKRCAQIKEYAGHHTEYDWKYLV